MRARSLGSFGVKDGSGKTASKYRMMWDDSVTGSPPWTRVGTTPLELSFRYPGSCCLDFCKFKPRLLKSIFFSNRHTRTFFEHVDARP